MVKWPDHYQATAKDQIYQGDVTDKPIVQLAEFTGVKSWNNEEISLYSAERSRNVSVLCKTSNIKYI